MTYMHPNNDDANWNASYITWSKLVATYGSDSTEAQSPTDPQTNAWLTRQRYLKKTGQLNIMQIQLLNREGVQWDYQHVNEINMNETEKPKKYSKASAAKAEAMVDELSNRSCEEICDSGDEFAKMAVLIRTADRNGKLHPDMVAELSCAGFIWKWNEFKKHRTWDMWFDRLVSWTKLNGGDPNMNRRGHKTEMEATLANWVWTQRQLARKREITPDQINRLREIGVWFDQHAACVDKAIDAMEAHYAATGEWMLPSKNSGAFHKSVVRGAVLADELSKRQKARLDAIGFDAEWTSRDATWTKHVATVKAFKEEHGHCNVPNLLKSKLRQAYKDGRLPMKYAVELEEMGFIWAERKLCRSFDEIVAELKAYKAEHGHLEIKISELLGPTVNNLRSKHGRGDMSKEDVAALDEIGFVWAVRRDSRLAA